LIAKQSRALKAAYADSPREYDILSDPKANITPTERAALAIRECKPLTLSEAAHHYLKVKGKLNHRAFCNSTNSAIARFTEALGDRPLNEYRRRDVQEFILTAVEKHGIKTGTLQRNLNTVKALVSVPIRDYEYDFKNPWEKQAVANH
jgi:hypothetical protein